MKNYNEQHTKTESLYSKIRTRMPAYNTLVQLSTTNHTQKNEARKMKGT